MQCLLNQLRAKEFISHRQCEDFMRDACNTVDMVRRACDKNCNLEKEVPVSYLFLINIVQ